MNKEIIVRAKAGDKAAKEEILMMFKPLVISCANNVYICGYEKSDLIQIGYISILKAIDSFDISSDSFAAYVNNSVRNNFYYLIRGKAKLNQNSELNEEILSCEALVNTEDSAMSDIEADELMAALEKLSHDDRLLIDYLFFKGYKLRECAKILNTSKSAISRRKGKILLRLRAIMKD